MPESSDIKYSLDKTKDGYSVKAHKNGTLVGSANIQPNPKGGHYGTSLHVDSNNRRKGIATGMYNYVEKTLKTKMQPRFIDSEEGDAFWKNRKVNESYKDRQSTRLTSSHAPL